MKLYSKALLTGAAALALATTLVASGLAAPKPPPLVVGHDPATCAHQAYTSINDAVAAAQPGDTIKVCAGTYAEEVHVTKALTIQGAQAGKDARNGRNNAAKESTVSNPGGAGFSIEAHDVTIDGFTIAGVNTSTVYDGIQAFSGTSGLTVVNDVITNNCNGINLQNPNGAKPALIRHDLFKSNTAGSGSLGAQ